MNGSRTVVLCESCKGDGGRWAPHPDAEISREPIDPVWVGCTDCDESGEWPDAQVVGGDGEIEHHPDCDGFRFDHVGEVEVERHPPPGSTLTRASCRHCDWRGHWHGKSAADHVRREASGHTVEVPCDGRCRSWV